MNVCILFSPNINKQNFEGRRLFTNLNTSLISNGLKSCELDSNLDILHIVDGSEYKKIVTAKKKKTKIFYSALMCENDQNTKSISKINDDVIRPLIIKTMNKCDTVLVSDESYIKYLKNNGVTSKIKILSPGVDINRFTFKNELYENLFYTCMGLEKTTKYIVSIGEQISKNHLNTMIEIAKKCKDTQFYYFGQAKFGNKIPISYHYKKRWPSNLNIWHLTSEEVYCSMLKNANGYLVFEDSLPCPITLHDVIASKTQIFAFQNQKLNLDLLNNAGAIFSESTEVMVQNINDFIEGKIKGNVQEAYEFICGYSLKRTAKKLIQYYKEELK